LSSKIAAGELWIVAPPQMPQQLRAAVGYLVHAGVDLAFGPGDVLPTQPPETLDGIKMILAVYDDIERIQKKLKGFRGFHLEAPDFYSRSDGPRSGPDTERGSNSFVMTFLHDNERTWLAVYGAAALGSHKLLESPLLLTGDLTLASPRMRERMLARSDGKIRESFMETVRSSHRTEWSDISFNMGKAMLDDYEATGDRASLDGAIQFTDRVLARQPRSLREHHLGPLVTVARLHDITGDAKYRDIVRLALKDVTDWPPFRISRAGYCHAYRAMSPETRAVVSAREGEMGSYGELMVRTYLPVMASAKLANRESEMADLIARCIIEQRKNLRDPGTGLYWHGIPSRREGQQGFMGHGHGWSTFGLSQILDFFPPHHPERARILDIHREQVEDVARFQDDDGSFHTMINWPWTHVNLHYTAWLGYAFLHGARMGWLNGSYRERGLAAWHALKSRTFWGNVAAAVGGNPVSRQVTFYLEHNCQLHDERFSGSGRAAQAVFTLHEVLRLTS